MSSSVPRQRLTELLDAALVEQHPDTTYALTELGHGAHRALRPLVRWSAEWAATLSSPFRRRLLALLISKRCSGEISARSRPV
jgi:DNA-binding HxlR family transcriptional regulator